MFIHFGYGESIFFESWKPQNAFDFVKTCIAISLISFLTQCITAIRKKQKLIIKTFKNLWTKK